MKRSGLFCASILAMSVTGVFGQSTLPTGKGDGEFTGPFPKEQTVKEPEATTRKLRKGIFSPHRVKGFHYKKQKVTHSAQYEFYERVEQAAKEHQRMLKKLAKPQYSNFLYYGHKRKPKIHTPDKMRYCKECGIRH